MNEEKLKEAKNREGEKGAAIVMVVLISFLLLVASAGLLLETSMNSANVTDAVSEQQAYNAAESGLQSAINVLRGNSQYQKTSGDKINFIKAIAPATSNALTDTTATTARLSRWMTYDYPATNPDRVTFGTATGNSYTTLSGFAYSVALSDPDNIGGLVSYTITGKIDGATTPKVLGSGSNTATITYTPPDPASVANLNVSTGPNINIGKFNISATGTGATVPSGGVRFEIVFKMTAPYVANRGIRGSIIPAVKSSGTSNGTITPTTVNDVKILFDSPVSELSGSLISITSPTCGTPVAPQIGCPVTPIIGDTVINSSVTPPEPTRILIRSTGYGPRGAKKQLEAIVQKDFFDGLSAPASLTLVGSSNGFYFKPGTSSKVTYSGNDVASTINIPSIGTTNAANLATVYNELYNAQGNSVKTDPQPLPTNISADIPDWLSSTYQLDLTIKKLKGIAESSQRYFSSGQTPTTFGNNATAQGITFCDGDVQFTGSGGGILVVTGKLTFKGDVNFSGLIIVTGSEGLDRAGSGGGTIQGNTVVAPYNPASLATYNPDSGAAPPDFLAPKYDISGGGTSTLIFNSSSVANGLIAVSNFVLGVAEK